MLFYVLPVLAGYATLCWALRFRREHSLRRRIGYDSRETLKKMTPEEAQTVIRELLVFEFPFMMYRSLEFGLFKTYGVESISRLLLATRNLVDPEASLKRYEDTGLMIGEFMNNPPNSNRAIASIARMNWLHSKYIASGQISNADLLYTLSVFVVEPLRFIRLYEWRDVNDMERCAFGVFWKDVGDAMGIQYEGYLSKSHWEDGLEFVDDITKWAKAYEVKAFVPSKVSARPATTLIPMMMYWVPKSARPFVQECVLALLGDRVREAFLLPEPGISATAVVFSALSLRRFLLRYLFLPRLTPLARHPHGQDIQSIDDRLHLEFSYGYFPFYLKPTFWSRWGLRGWAIWLGGGKLPGDDPDYYGAKGFSFAELGPHNMAGKGRSEIERDIQRIKESRKGGCPMA